MTLTIESLWQSLGAAAVEARQRRVDSMHPLDLYAEFEPPDRPGLVLVTASRPPERFPARSIELNIGRRSDGRWTLRMTLLVPALINVFAELCRDIIESTRTDVDDEAAGAFFIERIERWRRLLDRDIGGFSVSAARGLIGELAVLLTIVLPVHPPDDAIRSWTGPLGTPQDFLLPGGTRLEVKSVSSNADSVRISSLAQLDPGNDPLKLVVVRMESTGAEADGAVSVSRLIDRVRSALAASTLATERLDRLLAFTGWDPIRNSDEPFVRVTALEGHDVERGIPRLISTSVPEGVLDASYLIRLPQPQERWEPEPWN